MQPTLYAGEWAQVESCPVRVGDVVVFERCGEQVAHRLVARLPWPLHRWGLQVGDGHHLGTWIDLNSVVGVVTDPDVYEDIPPAAQAAEIACHLAWNAGRSEERRVGKECRSRWSPYH
mgnify:CR=1 FL=1